MNPRGYRAGNPLAMAEGCAEAREAVEKLWNSTNRAVDTGVWASRCGNLFAAVPPGRCERGGLAGRSRVGWLVLRSGGIAGAPRGTAGVPTLGLRFTGADSGVSMGRCDPKPLWRPFHVEPTECAPSTEGRCCPDDPRFHVERCWEGSAARNSASCTTAFHVEPRSRIGLPQSWKR